MYVLQNLHWFALLIGALVFFHELGHFVVAKLCDVQVTRFSLGFGPRLIGFVRGETEYTLSLLPLGGYVKMAGEDLADTSGEPGRGLAQKPLWQRALIVLAGPLANLLLAFVVYLAMFVGPHTFGDTKLGVVTVGDPAWQAGLRPGDRITAVDGVAIDEWDALQAYIGARPEQDVMVTFARGEVPAVAKVHAATRQEIDPFGQSVPRGKIGVSLQYVLPVVAVLDPASPAAAAGLKTGDTILAIGAHEVVAWHEVVSRMAAAGDAEVALRYRRDGEVKTTALRPAAAPAALAALVRESAADRPGPAGYTGLVALEACVSEVRPDSPAAKAGLQPMDRLLTAVLVKAKDQGVSRRPISVWTIDLAALGLEAGDVLRLEVQRQTAVHQLTLNAEKVSQVDEYKQVHDAIDVGASNQAGLLDSYTRQAPVGLVRAGQEALGQVWQDMSLIGQGISKMVRGTVPLGSMGGPIMLFVIAEKSAKRGWDSFGRAMAMTSVNLGLLNILPVPVLDGGHLLFYGIEAITRRPASARVREIANMIGLGLLLALMVVVFRNDISRFLLGHG